MRVCLCRDCGNHMLHALLVENCDFMTEEANGILFIAFPSIGRTQVMKLTWCPCMTVLSSPDSLPHKLICHELVHWVSVWAFTMLRQGRRKTVTYVFIEIYIDTHMCIYLERNQHRLWKKGENRRKWVIDGKVHRRDPGICLPNSNPRAQHEKYISAMTA